MGKKIDRLLSVFNLIKESEFITNSEIAKLTGVSLELAKQSTLELYRKDMIKRKKHQIKQVCCSCNRALQGKRSNSFYVFFIHKFDKDRVNQKYSSD